MQRRTNPGQIEFGIQTELRAPTTGRFVVLRPTGCIWPMALAEVAYRGQ